jgi:hypothetical protein
MIRMRCDSFLNAILNKVYGELIHGKIHHKSLVFFVFVSRLRDKHAKLFVFKDTNFIFRF